MKKVIVVLAVVFLTSMAANAQTDDGMMGGGMGGMMRQDQSGEAQLSPNASQGKRVFDGQCVSCHPNGGNIVTPNQPLIGSRTLKDFKTFLDFIRHPKLANGKSGYMPAFTKSQISDLQAEKLFQFIGTKYGNDRAGD